MNLVENVTDSKKKGVKLNPTKATLASTKATLMSLMYTVLRKLSRVVCNQKRNNANLKLVAARIITPENPLVLESASDNMTNYPNEEFTDVIDEDDTTQGEDDEGGDDESIGDKRWVIKMMMRREMLRELNLGALSMQREMIIIPCSILWCLF